MAQRRWTLLVVPEGSTEAPRSFAVSGRTLRAMSTVATVVGLIALLGLGAAVEEFRSRHGFG